MKSLSNKNNLDNYDNLNCYFVISCIYKKKFYFKKHFSLCLKKLLKNELFKVPNKTNLL